MSGWTGPNGGAEQARGWSRRRFLQAMALGGAAVLVGGRLAWAPHTGPWVKPADPFRQFPTNLETRLETLQDFWITPTDLFFVRNNVPSTPHIDAEAYRLRVSGDAVEQELELSFSDLQGLPTRTVVTQLECAGNWRSFSHLFHGQRARGGQWGPGAIGLAEWTGVPLRAVLELAGLKDNAVDVLLIGLDEDAPEGGFRRAIPLDVALDENTLLAFEMNGEPLPPDHGFPVRAIVPGWVGSNSIKWLGYVEVLSDRAWTRNTTTSYVLIGDPWPAPEGAPEGATGAPVSHQTVKSALALPVGWEPVAEGQPPRPARLEAGARRIVGFASPGGGFDWGTPDMAGRLPAPVWGKKPLPQIVRVEWRVDDGDWQEATLIDEPTPGNWVRFEFEWEAAPGTYTLYTRATAQDADGNVYTQPEAVPFNGKGYLFNQILPHPVEVVG